MSMTQQQINVDLFDQCKRLQAENVNVSDALKAAYKEIGHLEKELATLRAKAQAWDKGEEMWEVRDSLWHFIACGETEQDAWRIAREFRGWPITTEPIPSHVCRKVRVCEEVEE